MPEWRGARAVRECAALTADAIAAARKSIYIETQYLTASRLGDLLGAALARADGPEVVIVVTLTSSGPLEQFAMGHNRNRLLRRLIRADRFGRLRVYYPVVPRTGATSTECPVLVHSKVMVVDDRFLRVGSSNFNNRSIGLDTECDLALDVGLGANRRAIAGVRDRLLAEHLGVAPADVARAQAEAGSLVGAIDQLNTGERGLRPCAISSKGPTRPVFGTFLLDPEAPLRPLSFLRKLGAQLLTPAASRRAPMSSAAASSTMPGASGTKK
jgi:phosphatidylserine/phosphatidylglycerophosphate/cardiolipin synthase-like enzyme